MSAYDFYQTDPQAVKEGVWLDYPTFSIKVTKAGPENKKFKASMSKWIKPYSALLSAGKDLPEKTDRLITAKIYAESVILDWRGERQINEEGEEVLDENGEPVCAPFVGRDGQPLEFTFQNVVKVMTDLPDLLRDVVAQSQQQALFTKAETEIEAKNS